MMINLLVIFIGVIHVYFFILESYLYTGNSGKKIFKLNEEQIQHTKVLAFNQGYYNLCLGLGLCISVFLHNDQMMIFLLLFVVVVGSVGALSFSKNIFWVQVFPALVALIGYSILFAYLP